MPDRPVTRIALWRRVVAEFTSTALLVTAVVGSGIMAATLSPHRHRPVSGAGRTAGHVVTRPDPDQIQGATR